MKKPLIEKFQFKKFQHPNGLFPAAINSENPDMRKSFWIRDNYYIYQAVNRKLKAKMLKGFQKIIDNNIEKIKYHGTHKPTEDYMYIHPRYDKNLKEIPGKWNWVQNDSVGNLLEILSDARDNKRAKLIENYLNTIEYWNCPDFGFWEEGSKQIRSSSLASCIRGLQAYHKKIQRKKNPSKQIEQMINKGFEKLNSTLPYETETRKYDLALLSVLYPKQLVCDEMKELIIFSIQQNLEKSWGVKRYIRDTWNGKENSLGEDKEMQWTMGLPWLYLITGNPVYIQKATIIKQRYKTMPEGIINGWPNCTKNLLWAEAMFSLAADKFIKEAKSKKS